MIEANPRSLRAWRIFWRVGAGLCALAALLLGVRGVASFRARKVLTAQLAASMAEVARLGPPRAKVVLPAFDGDPVTQGDCPAAQWALLHGAPALPRVVAENAAGPAPNPEELAFAAAHKDEISAFGQAATRCDRVRPAPELGAAAWQQPLEMYRRVKALIIAGRVAACQGDVDTSALLFLQSQRLGFELGLDGSVVESIVGAAAIRDSEDALARLVARGLSPPLLGHIGRELAALEPITPDLANAVRLDHAEQATRVAGTLLEVPVLLDVLLPAAKFELSGFSLKQRLGAVILPSSAHAALSVTLGQAETDRALQDFARLDVEPVDLEEVTATAASSVYAEMLFPLAANKARLTRFSLLARSAMLHAALELAGARGADGRYPAAPSLPLDPLAPGQRLGYEVLPDSRYQLSSFGMPHETKQAWIIVSGPGTRAPEPPPANGAAR